MEPSISAEMGKQMGGRCSKAHKTDAPGKPYAAGWTQLPQKVKDKKESQTNPGIPSLFHGCRVFSTAWWKRLGTGGTSCMIVWMYLMPLNCILKNSETGNGYVTIQIHLLTVLQNKTPKSMIYARLIFFCHLSVQLEDDQLLSMSFHGLSCVSLLKRHQFLSIRV